MTIMEKYSNKLVELSISFAVEILNLVNKLKQNKEAIICKQLGRSGTSIGANIHEAQYAHGKSDFIAKLQIALKEANESLYWFKVLSGLCEGNEEIERLSNETNELRNVLQSILRSAKAKRTTT